MNKLWKSEILSGSSKLDALFSCKEKMLVRVGARPGKS